MSKSGWAGLSVVVLITTYQSFTAYLLAECLAVMAEVPGPRSLGSIAGHAFGSNFALFMNVAIGLEIILITAENLVVIGVHMQILLGWSRWIFIFVAAFLGLCQIYLSGMARFSAFGFLLSIIFVGSATICVAQLPGISQNTRLWGGFDGLIAMSGVVATASQAHAEIVTVYATSGVQVRKQFGFIVASSGVFVVIMYGLLSFFGYLGYGDIPGNGQYRGQSFTEVIGKDQSGNDLPGWSAVRSLIAVAYCVRCQSVIPYLLLTITMSAEEGRSSSFVFSWRAFVTLVCVLVAILARHSLGRITQLTGNFFVPFKCVFLPGLCFLQLCNASPLKKGLVGLAMACGAALLCGEIVVMSSEVHEHIRKH